MNLLLLHGFTSHPVLTLGPLPQVLREAGFQVSQPALPGHGTRPEDLLKVRWQDWLETARAFYRELPEPRGVVGLSMGALLSAHLAAETPTQALVALAPAMALKHPLAPLAPLLAWLIPRFPGPDSIQDPELKKQNPNYPYFPTRALLQLLALMRRTPEVLPKVKANALVIEAGQDKVVDPAGVRGYHALLGSSRKEYLVFPESGHDLLLDQDREAVALAVRDWLIANSTHLH
ncbi:MULTISPECIES: alpha/beta fold hydrolase [Thermus]|uniref:Carboxylesterase n=1 Tax=Thermus scotoductus (strain ATCC 700910 / SA-01) TaxID=743525 RepID=E8PQ59_THESS|nr:MULTISPECIES: alpha/beta fold hydrolase [Thermus]ADW22977.1 carboxylesterase [Thermus scotoductus SA-01]